MLYFIIAIFLFIFALITLGLSLIGSVFRTLFGFGQRGQAYGNSSRTDNSTEKETFTHTGNTPQKKIFTESDGEYVDFEEVKTEE